MKLSSEPSHNKFVPCCLINRQENILHRIPTSQPKTNTFTKISLKNTLKFQR